MEGWDAGSEYKPKQKYELENERFYRCLLAEWSTLLRQVPGMEVIQMNAVDFNVSVRGNNQLSVNKLLS
ncbi:MAG TPA: hypothetical protein VN647_08480 [Nitrospira sp.]|nr:hypothetical protein [Nitrospira sp.]